MTVQSLAAVQDGLTAAFRDMAGAAQDMLAALDRAGVSILNAGSAQKETTKNVESASAAAGELWGKLKGVADEGRKAALKVADLSDRMAQTRAGLTLSVDDGGSVDALEQRVYHAAQRSRANYMDLAATVADLSAGDTFAGTDEAVQFAESLNKQFLLAGASQEEMSAATRQLAQGLGAGTVQAADLETAFAAAPNLVQTLADYLGVPTDKIREMAAAGQISANMVKNAMLSATGSINEQFAALPMTWGQVWTTLQNDALMAFEPVLQKVSELANSEEFETLRAALANAVTFIADAALAAFQVVGNIAGFIYQNWSKIAPVIFIVAAAFAVYKAVTMLAAAAQAVFNAALWASPLTWVVVILAAIVGIIYWVVGAVNEATGSTTSALGVICGAFMTVLAVIGNILIALWNVVVDVFVLIYNVIADVANFLGNVFRDPLAAAARLFFGFVDSALSLLETLASVLDTLFNQNFAATIQGWRSSLTGWVDETFGKGEEYVAKIDGSAWKVKPLDYGDAWNMGYDFGEGVEKKVGDIFNPQDFLPSAHETDELDPAKYVNDGSLPGGTGQVGDGGGQLLDNTGLTAENTARMADTLEGSEEELKLIREIAERQAIDKFTTAEVRVDMTGMTNKIESGGDIDGFLSQFTVKLEDALYATAEGVHV